MRFKNIDFFRFIFAILIVLMHGSKLISLPDFLGNFGNCRICVDFFFIISGFFLFYMIKPETETWDFAKKRFFRLAPNVWLSIIIVLVVSAFVPKIHCHINGNILRLFLLNCVGFSNFTGGKVLNASWYVSALFWASLFYFYIYKIFDKKYFNLIVWLLIMFCYNIYFQYNSFGTAGGHVQNVYLVLNIGMCRALASVGLGYYISMAYKKGFLQNVGNPGKITISILEIYIISFLLYYLVFSFKLPGGSGMVFIVLFVVLFYFMLIKKGIISKLLENDISVKLGQYSYSIYCFHPVILAIFKEHISNIYSNLFGNYPILMYILQIFIAVIFGIILFYSFEKPISKFIKSKT